MPEEATQAEANSAVNSAAPVPEEALMMLMSMGFPQDKCEKALRATDNNIERASEWIFSHIEDDAAPMDGANEEQPASRGTDGQGCDFLIASCKVWPLCG